MGVLELEYSPRNICSYVVMDFGAVGISKGVTSLRTPPWPVCGTFGRCSLNWGNFPRLSQSRRGGNIVSGARDTRQVVVYSRSVCDNVQQRVRKVTYLRMGQELGMGWGWVLGSTSLTCWGISLSVSLFLMEKLCCPPAADCLRCISLAFRQADTCLGLLFVQFQMGI